MWGRSRGDSQKPYRLGYPNQRDDESENDMLRFYKGEISSKPSGDFIDKIHDKWFGDYGHLEWHHGYIQWIFPIRESGVNYEATQLQLHELKAIRADPVARARVIRSYEMMLDFYGMTLVNRETGEVARNSETYKARYSHLNSSYHNYLRISRILKALGEFGFERFKIHWINLFIEEIFTNGMLRNTLSSLQGFWVPTLRHKAERIDAKNRIHAYLKQQDTDDEGDDMGDNEDMVDIPSPPPLANHARNTAAPSGSSHADDVDDMEYAYPSTDEEDQSDSDESDQDQDPLPSPKRQLLLPVDTAEDDAVHHSTIAETASNATSVTAHMTSEENSSSTPPLERTLTPTILQEPILSASRDSASPAPTSELVQPSGQSENPTSVEESTSRPTIFGTGLSAVLAGTPLTPAPEPSTTADNSTIKE